MSFFPLPRHEDPDERRHRWEREELHQQEIMAEERYLREQAERDRLARQLQEEEEERQWAYEQSMIEAEEAYFAGLEAEREVEDDTQ